MKEVLGISGEHRFQLELVELTKKLAPEKLGAVLESLSPVGFSNLDQLRTEVNINLTASPRLKGKELLEQALSIFK